MTEDKIERINELARKKKSIGLTPEEQQEQKHLYQQFLKNIKQQVVNQLDEVGYTRKEQ